MTAAGERVVVGVDPSAEGAAAMRLALSEATVRGVPLTAARVWPDSVGAGYPRAGLLPFSAEEAEREAHVVVEQLVKQAREQVPGADAVDVEIRVLRGAPGPVLVAAAEDAALLVVGTRGVGAVSRALLGSVSEHVVHHASCPVAVVPASSAQGHEPARVLVGVDRSPAAHAALSWAADAAVRRGVALVPVLVRAGGRGGGSAPAALDADERRWLDDTAARAGLVVEPEVVAGSPGPALVEAAGPRDLLVVGSRGRGAAASALLGSTSTHVVRQASGPAVVVHVP